MAFGLSVQLMGAGTRLGLNRFEIAGDEYEISGKGSLGADPAAVFQVSGAFDLTVTNLSKLIAQVGVGTMLPGGQGLVDVLHEIGETGASEGARQYRVDIAPAGRITVNGHEISSLLEQAQTRQQ